MKLFFKFKKGSARTAMSAVLKALRLRGVTKVRRLFPGTGDPDRSLIYAAESATSATTAKHVRFLRSQSTIEYAEREKTRQPG